jgi:DME family drug/metabolite transporter
MDRQGSVVGVLLGLLAGSAYACYSWSAGHLMRIGHSARAVMGAMFGAGSLVLLPILALTGSTALASASGLIVLSYLAVVPMGLAYVLYGTGLRNTTVTAATTLSLLEPVVAALLSVLVAGEQLGPKSWVGMGLIGLGLVLVANRR